LHSDSTDKTVGSLAKANTIKPGSTYMATNGDQPHQPEPIDRRRLFLNLGVSFLFIVLSLFLPARTWTWLRGWLFLFVFLVASIVGTLYLPRVNPDVMAGRINRHERPRRWDLVLGLIFFLPTMLAVPIVAALDDGRYHWSHVPWWGCVLGYALMITGLVCWLPALPGDATGAGFPVGFDPCDLAVPAPGSANDLGGSNSAGRVAGLQGLHPVGQVQAGSWDLVIESFHITNTTTPCPYFSILAWNETMALLPSRE